MPRPKDMKEGDLFVDTAAHLTQVFCNLNLIGERYEERLNDRELKTVSKELERQKQLLREEKSNTEALTRSVAALKDGMMSVCSENKRLKVQLEENERKSCTAFDGLMRVVISARDKLRAQRERNIKAEASMNERLARLKDYYEAFEKIDEPRLLHSQAEGTLGCLELLWDRLNVDIPEHVITRVRADIDRYAAEADVIVPEVFDTDFEPLGDVVSDSALADLDGLIDAFIDRDHALKSVEPQVPKNDVVEMGDGAGTGRGKNLGEAQDTGEDRGGEDKEAPAL